MMKQVLLTVCFLLVGLAVEAQTETKQTVTVNGETVDKTVSRITFDGDDVVLGYTDNTTQRAALDEVNIAFTYTSTGIGEMVRATVREQGVYNLNGQYVGKGTERLAKGLYVKNGQKVIIK